VMAKKFRCHCGCGTLVSASTERRHRAGKATPRVRASHAARCTIYASENVRQTQPSNDTPSANLGECSSAPEIPRNGAHVQPMDVSGEPTSSISDVAAIDDDHQISDVIENFRENVCGLPHPPVTIEDYDDDEDDQGDDEDDGFDWDAELCKDYETNGSLDIEDTINENFEQELAEFGKGTLHSMFSTHRVPFCSRGNHT
jgi:hypothetical protein